MKKFLVIGAFGIFALVAVFIIASSGDDNSQTLSKTDTAPTAKLHIFSQGVSVEDGSVNEFVSAEDGQNIEAGTKVKTDSTGRAEIVYSTGTVTRIDKNSQVTLKSLEEGPFKASIFLSAGRIWSRVAKLLGGESYQTESTKTVATVRGTSYGHETGEDGDKVTTTDGSVNTACTEGTQEGNVDKGETGDFDCSNSDPDIHNTNSNEQDDWYNFNKDQDENNVLGTEASATPTPTPTPSPSPISYVPTATPEPLIDCVGADGITTKQTQETCDYVKEFWDTHPPAPEDPAADLPATPTPVPTPAINFIEETCTDIPTCWNLESPVSIKIRGTALDTADSVQAVEENVREDPEFQPRVFPASDFQIVSPNEINAYFNIDGEIRDIETGTYHAEISLDGGTNLSSGPDKTFDVTYNEQGLQ